MLDNRRSLMSLLIGVTLCFSIWHIMLQQQQDQYFEPPLPMSHIALTNDSFIPSTMPIRESNSLQTELPKNDFSQLIDLEDFEFLINHPSCKSLEQVPLIVILVHSAPDNFHKRSVIRETWGSFCDDSHTLLIFLVGAVNSTHLQDKIELEDKIHRDVLQGSFEDAYRNMTYKHVMALKWFVYNCPNAPYLLKTDDDVFVNLPLMYNYLETPSSLSQQFHRKRLIFCHEIAQAKVKRTYRSKWRVAYEEYLDSYFPNHCPGFSILYSADAVIQLYQQVQKLPYFWIDDVHITGNAAKKLNISIVPTNNLYLSNSQQSDLLGGLLKVENVPFFFARPNLVESEIRDLWKLVSKQNLMNSINDDDVTKLH